MNEDDLKQQVRIDGKTYIGDSASGIFHLVKEYEVIGNIYETGTGA